MDQSTGAERKGQTEQARENGRNGTERAETDPPAVTATGTSAEPSPPCGGQRRNAARSR